MKKFHNRLSEIHRLFFEWEKKYSPSKEQWETNFIDRRYSTALYFENRIEYILDVLDYGDDEEIYEVNSWLSWGDFPHIAFTSHAFHWKNKKDKYYSLKYSALKTVSRADLFSWLSDMPAQADIVGALLELKQIISQ